jgi:hypothetical protein
VQLRRAGDLPKRFPALPVPWLSAFCKLLREQSRGLEELLGDVTASSLLVTSAAKLGLAWFASGSQILGDVLNEYMANNLQIGAERQCDDLATLNACSHVYQDSE